MLEIKAEKKYEFIQMLKIKLNENELSFNAEN